MKTPYDTLVSLLRTEKGTELLPLNKYMFIVGMKANKIQVKEAVEQIYKVKVTKVNVLIAPGMAKRVRYQLGWTADWKKAIVTFNQGDKIDVT